MTQVVITFMGNDENYSYLRFHNVNNINHYNYFFYHMPVGNAHTERLTLITCFSLNAVPEDYNLQYYHIVGLSNYHFNVHGTQYYPIRNHLRQFDLENGRNIVMIEDWFRNLRQPMEQLLVGE